jgi:hypothetical protein
MELDPSVCGMRGRRECRVEKESERRMVKDKEVNDTRQNRKRDIRCFILILFLFPHSNLQR